MGRPPPAPQGCLRTRPQASDAKEQLFDRGAQRHDTAGIIRPAPISLQTTFLSAVASSNLPGKLRIISVTPLRTFVNSFLSPLRLLQPPIHDLTLLAKLQPTSTSRCSSPLLPQTSSSLFTPPSPPTRSTMTNSTTRRASFSVSTRSGPPMPQSSHAACRSTAMR
jgi:hypothetical protein